MIFENDNLPGIGIGKKITNAAKKFLTTLLQTDLERDTLQPDQKTNKQNDTTFLPMPFFP